MFGKDRSIFCAGVGWGINIVCFKKPYFYCLKSNAKSLIYGNTSPVAFQRKKNPPNIKIVPDFSIPFINSPTFKNYSRSTMEMQHIIISTTHHFPVYCGLLPITHNRTIIESYYNKTLHCFWTANINMTHHLNHTVQDTQILAVNYPVIQLPKASHQL